MKEVDVNKNYSSLGFVTEISFDKPADKFNLQKIQKYLPRRLAKFVAPAVLTVSAGVYGGAVCAQEDEPQKSSQLQGQLTYSLNLPFAPSEQWWYSGGPHSDGTSGAVKYAIDVTPLENAAACPGSEPYGQKPVRAIADGVVTVVGNENNTKDKFHSVVEIDHGQGFVSGSMHLDQMEVEVDQEVEQGDILGYVSCEFPPGGSTFGQHLHLYGKLDGEPIEIDKLIMSGWTIQGADQNYQGTMHRGTEEARTADVRRCGPNKESIESCGGIRNDISWTDPNAQTVPTLEPRPTLAPIPTIAPVPTVQIIPTREIESPKQYERLNPYDPSQRAEWASLAQTESYNMAWKFVNLLSSGSPADIEEAYSMQVPDNLEFRRQGLVDRYTHKGTKELLGSCSAEMDAGQTRDIEVKWPIPGGVPTRLTDVQYLNYQQGYDRERFRIHVNFIHNGTDARGNRTGFRKYDMYTGYIEPYIFFEVIGSKIYIAEPRFCTYELSPLNN